MFINFNTQIRRQMTPHENDCFYSILQYLQYHIFALCVFFAFFHDLSSILSLTLDSRSLQRCTLFNRTRNEQAKAPRLDSTLYTVSSSIINKLSTEGLEARLTAPFRRIVCGALRYTLLFHSSEKLFTSKNRLQRQPPSHDQYLGQ